MIEKSYINTQFGCFEIQGSSLGISSVKKVDGENFPDKDIPEVLQECVTQLKEYFEGTRQVFDLALDFGTAPPFHQAVWDELLKVPYARTITYLNIANNLGDAKSVRAVGQANRNNPIAIIVPCHRCIAKNGDLQGYFYGLEMKRRLLELENPLSFARQGSLF